MVFATAVVYTMGIRINPTLSASLYFDGYNKLLFDIFFGIDWYDALQGGQMTK